MILHGALKLSWDKADGNQHFPGAVFSFTVNITQMPTSFVQPLGLTSKNTLNSLKKKKAYVNNINQHNLLEILNFIDPTALH